MAELEKFYATFGFSHAQQGYIVEILATSREEANQKMFAAYGRKWAFMYDSLNDVHPADRRRGIIRVLT